MKKFLSLIMIMFSLFVGMQTMNAQSVNVGYLNSVYSMHNSNITYSMTGNGVYVGGDYDFNIAPNLDVTPGVYFDYVNYDVAANTRGNVFYLRVPIHLKYSYRFSNTVEMFGTAGPSLVYGLGGNTVYHNEGIRYTESFFGDGPRFDVPVGLELGVNINKNYKVVAGYDFGLVNQSSLKEAKMLRNVLHIGVGYNF